MVNNEYLLVGVVLGLKLRALCLLQLEPHLKLFKLIKSVLFSQHHLIGSLAYRLAHQISVDSREKGGSESWFLSVTNISIDEGRFVLNSKFFFVCSFSFVLFYFVFVREGL
jgi:hypothetical protein